MKRNISNRDLQRIADHAGVSLGEARTALSELPHETRISKVEQSASDLGYMITLRDRVAMAAGVSISTVNLAYRPAERHRLRSSVLQAIEQEASRLGYVPDLLSRTLRADGSRLVAICPAESQFSNPYFGFVLQALIQALHAAGYFPIVTPVPVDRPLPDLALSKQTAGVILWGSRDPDRQADVLRSAGREAVLFGFHPRMSGVSIDSAQAFQEVTIHALKAGYTTLHLGYFNAARPRVASRLEGVARALASWTGPLPELWLTVDQHLKLASTVRRLRVHDLPLAAELLTRLASGVGGTLIRKARTDFLDDRSSELIQDLEVLLYPTRRQRVAILGQSDFVARRLIHRLAQDHPNWTLGHEYGVSGHDDIEALLGFDTPILTTIRHDVEKTAELIVSLLVSRLESPEDQVRHLVIPHQVVYRSSL